MSDYQIIELLCSSDKANIEQAEQICAERKWKLKTILEKYGYAILGFKKAKDFLKKGLDVSYKAATLPELLPASLTSISMLATGLTALPNNWPKELLYLYLQQNLLTQLPANLPDSLQAVNCSHNQLSAIETLPARLGTLNCMHNQLTYLPPLPDTMQILLCSHNQLTDLSKLPPYLANLQCSHNQISQFPAALPHTLGFLDCSHNPDLKFDWLKDSQLRYIKVENCPHFSPAMLPAGFQQMDEHFWGKK